MIDSHDNKGSPQNQAQISGNDQVTDCQKVKNPISNPFPTPTLTNKVQMPMPREFNGKKYYGVADVAKTEKQIAPR